MPVTLRLSLILCIGITSLSVTGCHMVPRNWLRESQVRMQTMYGEKEALGQQLASSNSSVNQLNQQNDELRNRLEVATQRLGNLQDERSALQQKYVSLLDRAKDLENPLSQSANQKFADLEQKFPGFNFDPETGVSKFSSDLLFDSGSAAIKRAANPLLQEFAEIMSEGDASRLHILVVGHTDDKRIIKRSTAQRHPTNWHLSTNRANEVVVQLGKFGIQEARMGAAGYSMHQPVAPNTNDTNRGQNRRVEIFVLAPDAAIAGWDPSQGTDPVIRQ